MIVIGAVSLIYRDAAFSYFFNDDFHWLSDARRFNPANVLHLERYDHFYRPVIEVYFFLGQTIFGCEPLPFHVASIVIHLLNTLVLFAFARALTSSEALALVAALFFCVQPGYVEAVTWVGAITDLLPALWYLLTLWMHLLFLQRGAVRYYAASIVTFATCLLTHESSATLLPMMIVLEMAVTPDGSLRARARSVARHATRYAPFALVLTGYLAVEYIVNTRSYLVRDGHYAFGWHAVQNVLDYIVSLYVGKRVVPSYLLIATATAILLWKGSPRQRFFVLLMFVTLAPASFFTWGNASRYLYMSAAGFALLLADLLFQLQAFATTRGRSQRAVRGVAIAVATALTVRFAVFAKKGADAFPARTRPYEQFVAEVRRSHGTQPASDVVHIDRRYVEGLPALYVDVAAETALCAPDIRVVVRE